MSLTIDDFEISDLTQLKDEDVQQLLDRLASQLQELNPSLDLKRGAFHDTLLYLHAVLETAIRTNLERYQSARSLKKIEEDSTLADDTVVDEVLSNWGITRNTGTKAKGPVTIELEQARSVVIPEGSVFTANGNNYQSTATYVSRTNSGQVATDTDKLLTQLSNGNWAFTIEVESENSGEAYKLKTGTLVLPTQSITGYVTSYTLSDFSAGTDTETNAELLTKLQDGVAAKTLSNRTTMRAWLRSLGDFSSVTNQSIVGFGDAEMLRDQHTIFPVSYGGRVDWYIRTQSALQRSATELTATLVEINGNTSTWQFSLGKDVFPGFYFVDKIRRVEDSALNSGFEILQDDRGTDLTDSGFLPDIQTIAEGAFTAFQTTTIQFKDTATDTTALTVGDTATYVCEIAGIPYIKELQALVSSRDVRHYGSDVLIKAPVPCFVSVFLTINKAVGDASPDVDTIKNEIMSVVNNTDFIGRLDGSRIIDVVHQYLSGSLSVTELNLSGRILTPDNTYQYINSTDTLTITDQSDKMVTSKTVQFFAELDDIVVDVQTTIPTPD